MTLISNVIMLSLQVTMVKGNGWLYKEKSSNAVARTLFTNVIAKCYPDAKIRKYSWVKWYA